MHSQPVCPSGRQTQGGIPQGQSRASARGEGGLSGSLGTPRALLNLLTSVRMRDAVVGATARACVLTIAGAALWALRKKALRGHSLHGRRVLELWAGEASGRTRGPWGGGRGGGISIAPYVSLEPVCSTASLMSLHIPSSVPGSGLETSRKPTLQQALQPTRTTPSPARLTALCTATSWSPLLARTLAACPALEPALSHNDALSFSPCPGPWAAGRVCPDPHCPLSTGSPVLCPHLQSDTPEGGAVWAQQPDPDSLRPD